VKPATRVVVSHAGRNVKVELTRNKFNELTASLLHRTILFTRMTLDAAAARGHSHIDQIVLVGGSTKMPQIPQRLELEFHLPYRLFEPDEAIAKGAALYGQRLLFQKKVHAQASEIAKKTAEVASIAQKTANIATTPNTAPVIERLQPPAPILKRQQQRAHAQQQSQPQVPVLAAPTPTIPGIPFITNVASHSFGIIATIDHGTPRERKVISNLVRVNDPLPITQKRTYGTIEAGQDLVELEVIENTEETWIVEPEKFVEKARIGKVVIKLPTGLPENAPIEVTFELNAQGRLHVTGREPHANTTIDVAIETQGILSPQEVQQAQQRAEHITIL
jgi:molecular chaperone DnaK (HSP70)